MTGLDGALALAELGWPVFPGELDGHVPPRKVPIGSLVEHGFHEATLNPRRIALWWRLRPDAIPAVSPPKGVVMLDVDIVDEFEAAGLELPDGPGQQTPSGGYHRFFRTDGRRVRQTVKEVPGADTRVGGKGYVFAWQPDQFPFVEELPMAPEWLYAGEDEPEREEVGSRAEDDADLLIGSDGATHRDQVIAFAGRLRWAGSTTNEILQALRQARLDGRIVDGDEAWPWSDEDFVQVAKDLGSKPGPEKAPPVPSITFTKHDAKRKPARQQPAVIRALQPTRVVSVGLSGNALLDNKYPALRYFVDELLPEGFGIIAGPPKVGKSWLILQTAIEVAIGGTLLDRPVTQRKPVLYYALEDGERRIQSRLQILLGVRGKLDLSWLEIRFESTTIGNGLEDDIADWLDAHPGGLAIVDVLAKVRPAAKGRGSAYDEDYSTLKPLHEVAKARPGSGVIVITHLRKAGADDFLNTVQGTTGVTGSADWTWVVTRDRMSPKGIIRVTGRDIEKEPLVEAVFNGSWTAIGVTRRGGSKQRDITLEALLTEGDSTPTELTDYINANVLSADDTPFTRTGTNQKLAALAEAGLAEQTNVYTTGPGGGHKWHGFTEDEIEVNIQTNNSSAQDAVEAHDEAVGGDTRVITVHRVASRVRGDVRPRASAPSSGSSGSSPTPQPEEGEEVFSRAGARTPVRAPAHTRGTIELRERDLR